MSERRVREIGDSEIINRRRWFVDLRRSCWLRHYTILPIILIITVNQDPLDKSTDNLQEVSRLRHIMSPTELVNLDINAILC